MRNLVCRLLAMLVAISLGLWLVLLIAEFVTGESALQEFESALPAWALILGAVRYILLRRAPQPRHD